MIKYFKEAEKYRPKRIKTLLIGESPPLNNKSYFYIPPKKFPLFRSRRFDISLPSTIFYHYFNKIPKFTKEYINFLNKLRKKGIFLVDIYNKPLKVRGNKENQKKIIKSISSLKKRLLKRKIDINKIGEENVIFLVARKGYKVEIEKYFQNVKTFNWIDFRMKSINF